MFSGYFGGKAEEEGYAIAVDSFGAVYIAGYTNSPNLAAVNPIQREYMGGTDVFVTKLQLRPRIISAKVKGKKLLVTGEGFENGGVILLDGQPQSTANNDDDPVTVLVSKRAGKKILPGLPVRLQVKGVDDSVSEVFVFTLLP
jgi:hypothetical protein